MNNVDTGLILLTYKGKILLVLRETIPSVVGKDIWRFIGGAKKDNKSCEETICSEVEKETSLRLETVAFLSSSLYNNRRQYFYHAELTDDHVNNIKRDDRQLLQFFSLRELEKLPLAVSTKQLISRHKRLLEKTSQN